MADRDELYVNGARIGAAIGDVLAGVRKIVGNVREYTKGIEDAARVASNPSVSKGADDE